MSKSRVRFTNDFSSPLARKPAPYLAGAARADSESTAPMHLAAYEFFDTFAITWDFENDDRDAGRGTANKDPKNSCDTSAEKSTNAALQTILFRD